MIFQSKQKKFECDLKVRLCGKRLHTIESAKYLGGKIDANSSWQCQVNVFSIQLNRDNNLLFKIRKYISSKIVRSTYFAIFESQLSYCSLPGVRILIDWDNFNKIE